MSRTPVDARLPGSGAATTATTAPAAFAACALLALAGCQSLIPTYERPPLPVAAAYPEPPKLGEQPVPGIEIAADIPWDRFFRDQRLVRLIELSLANNRDLRVAALNIEQTRALYAVRRADAFPTVGIGASAQRTPSSIGVVEAYAVGLAVSGYELDLVGRVRNLSEAALQQFFATEENRRAVQIGLVASVASTYISALASDELLRVTRQALETREESTRLTRLRFDAGASSEIDFRQAESLLEAARVSLAQAERQRAQDENALQLLLGAPIPAELPAGLALDAQSFAAELPAGLPSDLLERRPDIRAAERQLQAQNANIGAARAAFFPRISLTATLGSASGDLDRLFRSGTFALTGTAQLLQPIFDAGRNRANLDVAFVARDIAVAQYERSIQVAFREVADALAGRATLGEQVRAQAAQANALDITYRLADLRYRNGAASFLDVLDAQRSLFAAQQALVQARALRLQNTVSLYRALGGGWQGG